MGLGSAYALSGRLTAALPLLEQAVEQASAMGMMGSQSLRVTRLGEAYLGSGRLDDARTCALQALGLAQTHKEPGHQAWTLRLLGEVAAQSNPPEVREAETFYPQCLVLADELGMRPLLAHCQLGLGTLYRKLGQQEQARAPLSTAVDLFQSMGMTFWLPCAEALLPHSS
jgi:tetratricopeptide (TPR) repeat protein